MTEPVSRLYPNLGIETQKPALPVFRRVMIGTDFSTASLAAFEQALKIARQNGAELVIAHAYAGGDPRTFMPLDCYERWDAESRREAEQDINTLVERAHRQGIRCHGLVVSGLPDETLLDMAKRLRIDLMVIGESGGGGKISRLFFSNVTARVLSHASCPILIVHAPDGTADPDNAGLGQI